MAKKSSIQRNIKRQKLVEKYAAKKAELKKVLADPSASDEEFFAAQRKLCAIPRNASKSASATAAPSRAARAASYASSASPA